MRIGAVLCILVSALRSWKGTSIMQITSTYVGTSRGHYQYLFFLLLQDYIQEENELSRQMKASLERFARDVGNAAALVRPFRGDIEATRRDVLTKSWPPTAEQEIQTTPSLLMINRDFDAFDPREHPWLQIRIPLQGHEDETRTLFERLDWSHLTWVTKSLVEPMTLPIGRSRRTYVRSSSCGQASLGSAWTCGR